MLFNSKLKTLNLKLLRYGFLCLITLLTISPATIRNYLASDKFVLISTNGPVNFWIGNNPYAEGWFDYPPPDYSEKIAKMVEEKGDKAYIEEVLNFAKVYPKQFIGLLFKKFLLFWDKTEIANNINYEEIKGYSWILKVASLTFGLLTTFSLLGIFLFLRSWRKNLLLYLFIFSFMLATVLFFVTARYRIAFVPSLIPFTGFTLWWWYERAKTESYQAIFLSLIPLIFFLSLTHSKTIKDLLSPYIYQEGFHINMPDGVILIRDNKGAIWQGKGSFALRSSQDAIKKEIVIKENLSNYQEATVYVRCAVAERNPEILIININDREKIPLKPTFSEGLTTGYCYRFISNALQKGINRVVIRPLEESYVDILIDDSLSFGRSYFLNKKEDWERLKKGEFMIWLSLHRKSSVKNWAIEYLNRGIVFYKENFYDKAIDNFKEAVRLDPNLKEGHYSLGMAYEKMEELDKAIFEYKRSLQLAKKDKTDKKMVIKIHNDLARIYYAKGMIKQVMEECRNILGLDPKNKQAYNNLINLDEKILDRKN